MQGNANYGKMGFAGDAYTITSTHADTKTIQRAYERINAFFSDLKLTATQLTPQQCWCLIATKSMEVFMLQKPPDGLPQSI